jgi:cellulose synthase (UDP-forming)
VRDTFRHIFFSTLSVRLLGIIATVYIAYYLYWRARYSLNMDALFFSALMLLAEFQGWFHFCLFLMMTWDTKPVPHGVAPPERTVDILIPTYNEDLSILKMTILGAENVSYQHKTWVLDDGRRPALHRLCQEMGIEYLTRADNKQHKAGNINAALAQTTGEFIAIFDADHVPLPTFLDHTLGYFVDEKVAFVQTPQEFYNLDSVQHHTNWQKNESWHEQSMFYRIIQPGKNRWNSAFWCGSGSVMRRSALMTVGGIAAETVTEDIHTSLRLHAAGWKSIYHDEVLCMGLAPQDFLAFTVQRLRWAQGAMQVLRRENPIFKRGLTLPQRLNYIASIFSYFEAFQRLLYTIAPAIVLISALLPIDVEMVPLLAHFLPYFFIGLIANIALGRGYFKMLETDRYNLLKMTTFIKASVVLLGFDPKSFKVTPKAASQRGVVLELLRPYYILIAIIVVGMIVGALRLAGVFGTLRNPGAFWTSEFWSCYNLWLLYRGVHSAVKNITRRNTYRFPVHLPVTIFSKNQRIKGITTNLHAQGIALLTESPLPLQEQIRIQIHLPQQSVNGYLEIRSSKQIEPKQVLYAGPIESAFINGGTFTPDERTGENAINDFLVSIMSLQLKAPSQVHVPEPDVMEETA